MDRLWAVGVGAGALAVYLRTLAPGLVGVIDSPVFQFVGRVLGVPHQPGYPLYVLVTHVFSFLPIGSLAYRSNLFSALCGAAAVTATFLVSRQLGCRRPIAAMAALGLAFGAVFWSQAVIAEVYTLHAALIAVLLLLTLVWGKSRRSPTFYAAVGVLALGLGHHTTIAAFVAALAVYALVTDRAFVTRPRTVLTSAMILAAGLLQYAFILLRSRDPAAYLESRATTLGELVAVASGAQFSNQLLGYSWHELATERVPFVLNQVLVSELTLPGALAAAFGAVMLLRRRPAVGLMLAIGAGLTLAFALTYRVIDTPVFLIPTVLVGWLWAAVALEGLAAAGHPPAIGTAVGVVALVLPGWNIVHNFGASDQSRRTQEHVSVRRLLETVPVRSAFLREDFLVDRMVTYGIVTQDGYGAHQVQLVAPDADRARDLRERGVDVFAFYKTANRLRHEGLGFGYAWLPVTGQRLAGFAHDLPNGTRVAIAVPGAFTGRFADDLAAVAPLVGGSWKLQGRTQANVVLAGIRGASRGALDRASMLPLLVHASVGASDGVMPDAGVELVAAGDMAAVRVDGREVIRSSRGAAVATWTADGALRHTFVLEADGEGRVPESRTPLSVFRLQGEWAHQEVAPGSLVDVTGTTTSGSLLVRLAPGTSVALCSADGQTLAPRVAEVSTPALQVEVGRCAIDIDGTWPLSNDSVAPAVGIDIALPSDAGEPASVILALGGIPRRTVARAVGHRLAPSVALFRVDTADLLRTPDADTGLLVMSRDEQSMLVGPGWSDVHGDRAGPFRWLVSDKARLLLPVSRPTPSGLAVQAFLGGDALAAPLRLGLRLNGIELSAQFLARGWRRYEWMPPPAAWRSGVNEAVLVLSGPTAAGGGVAQRTVGVATVEVMYAAP